ncbi:hypothetical protein KPH14_010713 [Odynerus spinipes]|uniref:Uncharacterized protein n=1 Tax=Odynerus spinipes TaxID=1348599 RepID=A0AAD9RVW8_9HYME|nr:hypothetical protein KPH14_010713 [Odynerus spinipes]
MRRALLEILCIPISYCRSCNFAHKTCPKFVVFDHSCYILWITRLKSHFYYHDNPEHPCKSILTPILLYIYMPQPD